MRSGELVDDYFRRFGVYRKTLAQLLEKEDCEFYESLTERRAG